MKNNKDLTQSISVERHFQFIKLITINKTPKRVRCTGYISAKTFDDKILWEDVIFFLDPWDMNVSYLNSRNYKEGFVFGFAKIECLSVQ
jgi:uncharacterized protein (DUF427 family)